MIGNYDHDDDGRLLEDYWQDEWPTVVEDFQTKTPEILDTSSPRD